MVHVCFGLHDKTGRYSKFTGTTILSLFENTNSEVTVHLLHDNTLTADNREKFIRLADRYRQSLKFYNVDKLCKDELDRIIEFNPRTIRDLIGTFYRLIIPDILSPDIKKIIYLDSDIIVNLDIAELWQIELGDKILAAVPEILFYKTAENIKRFFMLCKEGLVKCEDYFNAGVLVIDLNSLRQEKDSILNGMRFTSQYDCFGGYLDQDILNCCFSTRCLKLPIEFNQPTYYARRDNKTAQEKKIYHYTGGSFGYGLGLDMNDSFDRLWMNYFIKSTWFNSDSIGRIYEKFQKDKIKSEEDLLKLSSIVSGKTRAFVIFKKDIDMLVEKFSVKPGEEVFAIESSLPMQKLIELMNASRDKRIFFILLPGFKFEHLEAAGFVKGKDFLDGYDFLPEEYSIKKRKEAYSFIKTL